MAARAFRMLGMLNVPDVAPNVIAAMLAESGDETVGVALDRLVDAQLAEPVSGGRYRLHDIVKLVAAECALEEETAGRDAAVKRAIAFYAGGLWQAEGAIRPLDSLFLTDPPVPNDVSLPAFDNALQSLEWIDAELRSLIGIIEQAAMISGEALRLTPWLIRPLWRTFDSLCEWQTARILSERLLDSERTAASGEVKACASFVLGCSCACLEDYGRAELSLKTALTTWRHLGNQHGESVVLNALGIVEERRGDAVAALQLYKDALGFTDQHGLVSVAASILNNMSVSYALLGCLNDAVTVAQEALAIYQKHKIVTTGVTSLTNLATVFCLRGEHESALHYVNEALVLAEEAGDRLRKCEDLIVRSEVNRRIGRHECAVEDANEALIESRRCGYRYAAAAAFRQRARVLAALGRAAEAHEASALADRASAGLSGVYRDTMIQLLFAQGREQ